MNTDHHAHLDREPIAITGIGCQFPGGVANAQDYWELLCNGVDATRDLPPDRWETRKFYDPDPAKLGKMSTFRGGFLDRVDEFDPQFFGISPREAIWLDPQQRLLLRVAWEALEDAGQDMAHLAGSDTGVFIGGFTLDYQLLQNYGVHSRYELQAHSATGMMMTMLSNRLSHSFDFRGPSMTIDTACSGSLVALHLAAQALWNGDCTLALAGGVNVMLAPNMTIAESKGGFLSPDGRCKTFDSSANGYARGEGAGIVVLKPLSHAQRDGDPIYALVRGTAVTQDGHTNGITVPNGASQEAAMRTAYARAGVAPSDVQYVEAHGTGTPVGDPIEAAAIGRVLSTGRTDSDILIGSVKTNIGHLEAAAGVAGVIKTALALKHGRIPAHLHLTEPNPDIPFDEFRLRIPTQLRDWPATAGPRLAGVNSFGFGGTNAHAVLQGPPVQPAPSHQSADPDRPATAITLSARSAEALRDQAETMCRFLEESPHRLADVAYSCSARRTQLDHRLTVVARDTETARAQLRAHLDGRQAAGVVTGRTSSDTPKVAFVFSGMGPQWWAMGRQLLTCEPVFRAAVQDCDTELAKRTGWSLMDEMLADEQQSRMDETEVAQPANFAIQVGLAKLLQSWGIEPAAIIGHSAGEVAAQHVAGVLTLAEATQVIYYRSTLQQRTSGTGRMLAVGMTPETLNQAVADAGPAVSIAAINSPSAVTLSGDPAILEGMAAQLETFGVFHRFLPVKVPYHSHYMDPLRDELEAGLHDLAPRSAVVPLYSIVTGSRIDGSGAGGSYWWQNVRSSVLFAAAFNEMIDDGYTHFVEIAPHPVLASSMRELLAGSDRDSLVVPTLRRHEDDHETLLTTLGALHCHGHPVNWKRGYRADARYVKLPSYSWQLKSYWNESQEAREDRHYQPVHPLLGQRMNAAHPTWELEIDAGQSSYLADHRIQHTTLLPGAALIEMALAAAHQVYGAGNYSVDDLKLHKALSLGATSDARLRTTLYQDRAVVEMASFLALPSGERQWTVHATAQLAVNAGTPTHRDLATLNESCDQYVSREQFYAQTEAMGFQYGPTFQGVREVNTGTRIAVGRIAIPDQIATEMGEYLFHPCLIDAAFQVLLIAATPPDANQARVTPYLPVAIERVRVLAPPQHDMIVIAEVRTADRSRIVSDLTLCDTEGRVLVTIDGFQAQSLETAASLSLGSIDNGLYEVQWQESGRPCPDQPADPETVPAETIGTNQTPDEGPADWLLFTDASGVGAEVAATLRAGGHRVHCVRHGQESNLRHDGGDSYTIDAGDPAHYGHLLELLRDRTISTVVHLWGIDAECHHDASVDALAATQKYGSLSVMWLMQALSGELTQIPKVWLVTRGAQPVGDTPNLPALAQAPLWGLGRVIGHQEFATLWGGLCDLDPHAGSAEQARRLIDEIRAATAEDQVAFRGDQRYVARLVRSPRLTAPFPVRMRSTASYLVTGGLGALGILVARFLIDRGARHVILMGRTPLAPRSTWDEQPADHPQYHLISQIRELESGGAKIHLAAADVTDPDSLQQWQHTHLQQGLPPVAGLVHTAGVVDDELLVRMDAAKFEKVLRPKIIGGWLLHRMFADADLDFFALFSSTGSVIASPGQGNYAAGNAFLDALAHYRRQLGLPAVSIGWGPWSVGMVEHLHLEQMYARRGIELISPDAGAQILGRVLQHQPAHLVAITVDWATARETSLTGHMPPMFSQLEAREDSERSDGGDADSQALLAALRASGGIERIAILSDHLRKITARVLGLEPDQVSTEETLSALGLDSMMAIEMKHRIEAALTIDVSVLDLLQGNTIAALAEGFVPRLPLGQPEPQDTNAESTDNDATDLDDLEAMLADAAPEELLALLEELNPHSTEDIEALASPSHADPGA
ncbi:type I polyketide synthase [Mycobacterium sp. BMJ-28]